MKKIISRYTTPCTEIVVLSIKDALLKVEGTHSVENYKEKGWVNVGGNDGDDDEIIPTNASNLWDN